MDTRKALTEGTQICFRGKDKNIKTVYTVTKELARGGSCIVYDGFYRNNTGRKRAVRIKECYPFALGLTRGAGQTLRPRVSDKEDFEKAKERMRQAFDRGNDLFAVDGLTNAVSNTLDLYEENNTVYIVSAYQQGETLTADTLHTLRDCIGVVKSAARALYKIHEKGWLYLDMKPENIFVLEGTAHPVQLFDFDSLVKIPEKGEKTEENCRISYTGGFAALEHQMGQYRKLGKYTDVYSIGAVLFYLVFGRAPNAADCDGDAGYLYAAGRYSREAHPEAFYQALTSFFHHTLASCPRDRYPDMAAAVEKLEALEKLADRETEYLLSTRLVPPAFFIGRQQEEEALRRFLLEETAPCLFVTGMGGIGKSTLVRRVLCDCRQKLDNILYVPFCASVRESLSNDSTVTIHGIEKSREESGAEYFARKLRYLRAFVKNTKTVLVLDDFAGELDEDFALLLQTELKLILISRKNPPSEDYPVLHLGAMENPSDLYRLFEKHRGTPVKPEEEEDIRIILDAAAGHTLVLELLAKQLRQSRLTLHQAAGLVRTSGFSRITGERVRTEKDFCTGSATVRQIIGTLFSAERESEEKQCLLKALTVFDASGVPLALLEETKQLVHLNDLGELLQEGWVQKKDEVLSLHPVVREAILQWSWTKREKEAALQVLTLLQTCMQQLPPSDPYHQSPREVRQQNPLSEKKQRQLLALSKGVLTVCRQVDFMKREEHYFALLFETVLHLPREEERFLQKGTEYLLKKMPRLSYAGRFSLTEQLLLLADEKEETEKARGYLLQLEKIAKRGSVLEKARYYDCLADFYDSYLGGAYDTGDREKTQKKLQRACEKAVKLLCGEPAYRLLRVKHMLSLANLFLRQVPCRKEKAHRLLSRVYAFCRAEKLQDTFVERDYFMSCGWYYTHAGKKPEMALHCIEAGMRLAKDTCPSPLSCIDEVMIPAADISLCLDRCREAERILTDCIAECSRHPGVVPFLRKKAELSGCLLDVYAQWGQMEKGRALLAKIREDNRENAPYGVTLTLPPEKIQFFDGENKTEGA